MQLVPWAVVNDVWISYDDQESLAWKVVLQHYARTVLIPGALAVGLGVQVVEVMG